MKVIIYNTKTKQSKYAPYPSRDITKPVPGLDSDLRIYMLFPSEVPTYNGQFEMVHESITYTDEATEEYPHIYKAITSYTVSRLSDEEIIDALNNSVGSWIERHYPYWKQLKYSKRRMSYIEKETLTKEEQDDYNYIKSIDAWAEQCRIDRDQMESNFIENGVLPSLQWSEAPQRN